MITNKSSKNRFESLVSYLKRILPQSITQRLVLVLTVLILLVSATGISISYITEKQRIFDKVSQQADSRFATLTQTLGKPLWDFDYEHVRDVAQAIMRGVLVSEITITDSYGAVVFSQSEESKLATVTRSGNIYYQGQDIGNIKLILAVDYITEFVDRFMLTSSLVLLVNLLVFIIVIIILLPRFLRKPLQQISQVARAYGAGKYDITPDEEIDVEFRPIIAVLKQMAQMNREHVANLEAEIDRRKTAEMNLKLRLVFEKAVATISTRFATSHDINTAINASLADIGRSSKASRSYLFLLNKGNATMDNTHEFCSPGVSPQIDNLKNIPCDMFPWWIAKLCKNETIHVSNVSAMPEEAKAEREILEVQDIKSLLVLPVFTGAQLVGFIGFDNVVNVHGWSDEDTAILRIAAEMIGGALERNKMQAQLMAQDRLASIGQLVSGVAHEINNPLTGVIGFSDLLLGRNDLPDDVKADLKIVNDEARRTVKIVKNLLTFARKQPEGKAPVDINEQIQRVLDLRNHEQTVNNIQVVTHFVSYPPWVMGNASQLQQVFFNIIINAEFFMLKAHQKGTLTITTEQKGDFVRASFTDDGPGIPKENIRNLFTPFFTTKEVGKGTGLGLSICHGIITEHGGRIWAKSEPGKGATFVIELPIRETIRGEEKIG